MYYPPWTGPAKAYPHADTLTDITDRPETVPQIRHRDRPLHRR